MAAAAAGGVEAPAVFIREHKEGWRDQGMLCLFAKKARHQLDRALICC